MLRQKKEKNSKWPNTTRKVAGSKRAKLDKIIREFKVSEAEVLTRCKTSLVSKGKATAANSLKDNICEPINEGRCSDGKNY